MDERVSGHRTTVQGSQEFHTRGGPKDKEQSEMTSIGEAPSPRTGQKDTGG